MTLPPFSAARYEPYSEDTAPRRLYRASLRDDDFDYARGSHIPQWFLSHSPSFLGLIHHPNVYPDSGVAEGLNVQIDQF